MAHGGLTVATGSVRPWLQPLQPWSLLQRPSHQLAVALVDIWPRADLPDVPRSAGGRVVQPVAAVDALGALAYEQHIAATGQLPTRDNAHDWYNALAWLAWPRSKACLNALQVEEGERGGEAVGANGRTRRRDALTLLDENGAVLVTASPSIAAELAAHAWTDLFVRNRARWASEARVWLIGHAMLEKLEVPRLDLCAHVRVLQLSEAAWGRWCSESLEVQRRWLDSWLCEDIRLGLHTPADLLPLPLMGIPGWHPDNADSDFYNNQRVFRPLRRQQTSLVGTTGPIL